MSLEYLSKYLNKDERPKKRKRDGTTRVVEDDLTGWSKTETDNANAAVEAPVVVNAAVKRSAGFQPAYTTREEDVDRVKHVKPEGASALMQNGSRAGLRTREDMQAEMAASKAAIDREMASLRHTMQPSHQETVYRDATGRRIDITLAKQERLRALKREELKAREQGEMAKGLVQRREKAARDAELSAVRAEGFSRYAGDAQAEVALRVKQQWNDPAAQFLTTGRSKMEAAGRPTYKGGFAPNRFGIRPGYRWDGVDRGNGYEAKRFKAFAQLKQRRDEYEDWAKEDM